MKEADPERENGRGLSDYSHAQMFRWQEIVDLGTCISYYESSLKSGIESEATKLKYLACRLVQ